MIAMPSPENSAPLKRRRWDLSWVVAVTRNRKRVIYACVPSAESARSLKLCAIRLGYRDATVERMDVYIRSHGTQAAKDYLAAMDATSAGSEGGEQAEPETRPAALPVTQKREPARKDRVSAADYQQRGYKRRWN